MNASNFTNSTASDFWGAESACLVFEVFAMGFVLYVFSMLIYSARNKSKINQRQSVRKKRRGNGKVTKILTALFVTLGFVVISKSLLAFSFYPMKNTHALCVSVERAHQYIHTIGMIVFYLYLWQRQYSLYKNQYFKRLATITLRRFSFSLLFLIFAVGVMAMALVYFVVRWRDYHIVQERCRFTNIFDRNDKLVAVAYAFSLVVHGCLVFLFVHILRRQQALLEKQTSNLTSSSKMTGAMELRALVRTCFLASSISVASDVTFVTLDLTTKNYTTTLISNTFYDISMLCSFICSLLCFANYKQLFLPCMHKPPKQRTPSGHSIITSVSQPASAAHRPTCQVNDPTSQVNDPTSEVNHPTSEFNQP